MDTIDLMFFREELLRKIRMGVVEVTFTRAHDGETRVMHATLAQQHMPRQEYAKVTNGKSGPVVSNGETLRVWDTDLYAWRSFRVANVTGYKDA